MKGAVDLHKHFAVRARNLLVIVPGFGVSDMTNAIRSRTVPFSPRGVNNNLIHGPVCERAADGDGRPAASGL